MKILWITNIKMPPLSESLGEKPYSVGGWMISSLRQLQKHSDIEIAVATFGNRKGILDRIIEGVRYFLVPTYGKHPQKYNKKLEVEWKKINEIFRPDVVHIHGTEMPHGLAWVKANGGDNVCVSIQGLVSVYSRYYTTGSWMDYFPLTFRDLVKVDWISRQRRTFVKCGEYEKELLKSVNHIVGRTEWDKCHSWAINPKANYHLCGETLRNEFYRHKWNYKACTPHTIFISQGHYPIKGLHKIFEALPLILKYFPDTHVYVGGFNITEAPWFKKTGYAVILRNLIKKFKLQNHVSFIGMLDEKQMCNYYLRCNVFVLPSAIENSPNSLGEAQLLGVPFLTTYCGGTPEIVNFDRACLYRYEEIESLAYKICNIFNLKGQASREGNNNLEIYDENNNTLRLIEIYKKVKIQ